MKLFANIPFGFFMYRNLLSIRKYHKDIIKYRAEGNIEAEKEAILNSERTWATNIMKKMDVTLNVTGLENVPKVGPVVFVANHQGYADIAIFAAAIQHLQFAFVAKANLAKLPGYGKWVRDVRSVFIDREDPRASLRAIQEGIRYLEQGFSLGIFPEGKRSKGPVMGAFKKGSLRLATKPGVPIVPVTISGSYRLIEEQGKAVKGGTVDFFIHPMIETKDMGKKETGELSEKIEEIIHTKLTELQEAEMKRH